MGKWIVTVAVLFLHLATGGQAHAVTYSVKDGAAAGEFIIVLTNEIAVRGGTICFLLDPTDISISTIAEASALPVDATVYKDLEVFDQNGYLLPGAVIAGWINSPNGDVLMAPGVHDLFLIRATANAGPSSQVCGLLTFPNGIRTAPDSPPQRNMVTDTSANSVLAQTTERDVCIVTNKVPVVSAGTDQEISLPDAATLSGSVSDDGFPKPPGIVSVVWSMASGPGNVTFGSPSAVRTTASFSAAGTYVFRLTANDGLLEASDTVTVIVDPAPSPSIGHRTVFTSVTTSANRRGQPVTMPESGTIQSVTMYHNGGSGRLILAIYDGASLPDRRLAVTAAVTLSPAAGWQTALLTSPVPASAGQRLWLAWVFERNPGIRYTTGTPGRAESAQLWAGGMPDAFGPSTTSSNIYSIYATYVKGSVPTSYTVTVTSGTGGTIGQVPTNPVPAGSDVDFVASPNPGCSVDTWFLDGAAVQGGGNSFFLDNIQADHFVDVTFRCCQPGTGTAGSTAVYASVTTSANRRAQPVTMSESGTIQNMEIYHNGGSGRLILAIYDGASLPDRRIAVTAAVTVNPTAGWQTVPLSTSLPVFGGQRIWLAWVFERNPGIRYTAGAPGRVESTQVWAGGMPDAFGAGTVAASIYSIHATYTKDCVLDFDVIATAGPGGSIQQLPPNPVPAGTNVTLTATPDVASVVDQWFLDGVAVPGQTGASTLSLANVQADHTVLVTFKILSILGNQTVFSLKTTSPNRRALPFVIPVDGTIRSLRIYHEGGTGGLLLAVYDGATAPVNRLATTAVTPLKTTAGWQEVALTQPLALKAGAKIWLAWVFERNPGIRYTTGASGRAESIQVWAGGMPATFGASTQYGYIYSICAVYSNY